MTGRIPQTFLDDLITRIDIVELIDARVPLRKAGRDYMACCPFHTEKTPSFTVSPTKQFYHCFGCGAHGTAIGFLMAFERLGFIDAVTSLADQLGVEMPKGSHTIPRSQANKTHYEVMEQASQFFQQQLRKHPQAPQVITYLKDRGLSGEIAKTFEMGFAPPGWHTLDALFGKDQNTQKTLATLGLLIEKEGRYHDRFRNRVIFPIRDPRGRVMGFGGRVIDTDDTPKYLNSPESPIFHKGRELYGLYEARQAQHELPALLIVEGYMDVVALAQHGITNAVATLGTATTSDHLQKLFRASSQLIFCFDGDKAGRAAAWRALETALPLLRDGVQVHFMFLPDGEDPDSLVRQLGKTAFLERAAKATSLSDFLLKRLTATTDLSQPANRAKFTASAAPLLNRLPRGVFFQSLLDKLASMVHINSDRLERLIVNPQTHPVRSAATAVPMTPVRLAIALLLQNPQLARTLDHSDETLASSHLPGIDILYDLLKTLHKHPTLTTGALLERWRDKPQHPHLEKLTLWQNPIPDKGIEAEFLGTLDRIRTMMLEQAVDALLKKATESGLTDKEKHNLQTMIKNLRSQTKGVDHHE